MAFIKGTVHPIVHATNVVAVLCHLLSFNKSNSNQQILFQLPKHFSKLIYMDPLCQFPNLNLSYISPELLQ